MKFAKLYWLLNSYFDAFQEYIFSVSVQKYQFSAVESADVIFKNLNFQLISQFSAIESADVISKYLSFQRFCPQYWRAYGR